MLGGILRPADCILWEFGVLHVFVYFAHIVYVFFYIFTLFVGIKLIFNKGRGPEYVKKIIKIYEKTYTIYKNIQEYIEIQTHKEYSQLASISPLTREGGGESGEQVQRGKWG